MHAYSLLLGCLLASFCTPLWAQPLTFFESFTDGMVLQREVNHPIWGWAKPKASVQLFFQGKTYTTKANAQGRWEFGLPPQAAGGPMSLSVRSGKASLALSDIYFGDVYLLSGQSNMEWQLGQSDPDGSRAAVIADPLIREITIAKSTAEQPEEHLSIAAPWRRGTVEHISTFSALGSYFAHYLRKEVEVPIGLLHSSWGGSRIEPWMSEAALALPPDQQQLVAQLRTQKTENALARYRADFGANAQPPKEDRGEALAYWNTETDYSRWPSMELPGLWETRGYDAVDGHFYFAKVITLSEAQVAQAATLYLGAVDDSDWTYFNGQLIGATYNQYSEERIYTVPATLLKAGRNIIVVRVEDTGGGGGLSSSAAMLRLETAAGSLPLAGTWYYQIGSFRIDASSNQMPVILYNKMIHPLAGMPLKGILWYQGESNTGGEDALRYANLFPQLINSWRSHFKQPDLPFYWAQLANFQAPQKSPDEEGWGSLRNSQTATLSLPNTGQAVIIDIGEADDIHPRNKWEVGRRLSLHALKNIYGMANLTAASPMVAKHSRDGSTVLLAFNHVPSGLVVRDEPYGYAKGFVYQNEQGRWQWAPALLQADGKTIAIYPRGKDRIQAIRYAWANNPADANVFSLEGLPLTPFHLDIP